MNDMKCCICEIATSPTRVKRFECAECKVKRLAAVQANIEFHMQQAVAGPATPASHVVSFGHALLAAAIQALLSQEKDTQS
jgi:hypothetical protein